MLFDLHRDHQTICVYQLNLASFLHSSSPSRWKRNPSIAGSKIKRINQPIDVKNYLMETFFSKFEGWLINGCTKLFGCRPYLFKSNNIRMREFSENVEFFYQYREYLLVSFAYYLFLRWEKQSNTFKADISLVRLLWTSMTTPKAPVPKSEMTLNALINGRLRSLKNTSSKSQRPTVEASMLSMWAIDVRRFTGTLSKFSVENEGVFSLGVELIWFKSLSVAVVEWLFDEACLLLL